MRKALIALPIVALMLLVPAIVIAKTSNPSLLGNGDGPTPLTVTLNQAQLQWRGISAFGDWTPGYSYMEYATSSDFNVTGNVLHTSISYSPSVEDLEGESSVYVYNKSSGLWIEREGQVKYVYIPGYGDTPVVNFWRGYLDFGGNAPSTETFVHGVGYQWAYLYLPEDATLTGDYTAYAQWDAKVGAWLVGFSIYLWDPTPQSYTTAFPDPFPEPVPANVYNPLGL